MKRWNDEHGQSATSGSCPVAPPRVELHVIGLNVSTGDYALCKGTGAGDRLFPHRPKRDAGYAYLLVTPREEVRE